MLAAKNKFDQQKQNNNQLSVILKRPPLSHVNLIINQEMKESFHLSENVMTACEFAVKEDGYYHISSQLTLKNISENKVLVDYYQLGVCLPSMDNYHDNLKSNIINSCCQSEYVIADNLCCIMYLRKNEKNILWLNFGSAGASDFQFQSQYSNLRLYKL